MAERPLGITIISILGFIGAFLTVIGGIALSSLGTFLTAMLGPLGALGALAGIALIVVGIVQFVISYGLWKMKKWAFYIEMILLALGVVLGILSLVTGSFTSIISIIIEALIIYYLYTKRTLFS
jgi:uncharacterized membrane protein (DUF2068 family)